MKIAIAFLHLINFAIVALQRIEAGKGSIGQLHHDLITAGRAVGAKTDAEIRTYLVGFVPMLHNTHWDSFRDFMVKPMSPKEVSESGRELNFFTGKPVPQNPIAKAGTMFGDPESPEALQAWIESLNASEGIVAMTAVGMAQNLFSKLVDEELEATK